MSKNPVIILVGEEPYLISRELKGIVESVFPSGKDDFNLDRFSAKSSNIADVLRSVEMLPMMATQRLVILTEAHLLKKDDLSVLTGYFERVLDSTLFVLVAQKIDKRLSAWQRANKKGWVKELKAPYPDQMSNWLVNEAKSMGLNLKPKAAHYMREVLGNLLMAQVSALEKAAVYVLPKIDIELSDVEAVLGGFKSQSIFDLTDSVGKRQFSRANALVHDILEQGEPPVRLMFMVSRHFRMLLLAQEGMRERLSERDIAKKLGVHPFFVKDYIGQAKKISSQKLRDVYQKLLEADRALKSLPLSPESIVEKFLMETCLEAA